MSDGAEVRVRGLAERRVAPERATVLVNANVQGRSKSAVLRDAAAAVESVQATLRGLEGAGVTAWSSGQIHTYTARTFGKDGKRLAVHHASLEVRAEFVEFERLSSFLDDVARRDGIDVAGLSWDLLSERRIALEAEVRREAVADAVAKATTLAEAVGRTQVVAVRLDDTRSERHEMLGGATMAVLGGADGPAVSLEPAQITVSASVDVRFWAT